VWPTEQRDERGADGQVRDSGKEKIIGDSFGVPIQDELVDEVRAGPEAAR
jgi:hypothetical protein